MAVMVPQQAHCRSLALLGRTRGWTHPFLIPRALGAAWSKEPVSWTWKFLSFLVPLLAA